jgi:DNA-binding CsgD family transcriptional regulator
VRSHVKRVYKKLSVRSSTEAVAKALKSGLVA